MAHVVTGSSRHILASAVCLATLFGPAVTRTHAADGDLDPLFGSGGVVTASFRIDAIAIQNDGRIVAAGNDAGEAVVARYNRDGSLDGTFGLVFAGLDRLDSARVFVAIDHQQRVVVAGRTRAARFTWDGFLDTTFGADGRIAIPAVQALAVQPDGRIAVVGSGQVAFYDGSGHLISQSGLEPYDTAFCAPPPRPCVSVPISTYTILPNDIVLGAGGSFLMVAYDASGRLLGPRPAPLTVGLGRANAVTSQPDGKILAAGVATTDGEPSTSFMLARYDDFDASLDATFNGGIVTTAVPGSEAVAIALQENGKIVAAGTSAGRIALVRYLTDGTRDESFGAAGIVITDLGIIFDEFNPVRDVAIEPNGDIVVAAGNALLRYVSRAPIEPRLYYLSDGRVQELAQRSGTWHATDLHATANASAAAGTSLAAFASGTAMDSRVYYLDAGGNVQELARASDDPNAAWHAQSVGLEAYGVPAAPGSGVAGLAAGPQREPRVYYFDSGGMVQELAWFSDDGGGMPARWHARAIGEEARMPPATEGSALAALASGPQREPRVYYIDTAGLVQELGWFSDDGGSSPPYWHLRTISQDAHKPPAALNSRLSVADPGDTPRVYYVTDVGDVKELAWVPRPNLWRGDVAGDAVTNSAIAPFGETVYTVLPEGVIERARIVRSPVFSRPATSTIDPLTFAVPSERADALYGSGMVWLEDSLYYISAPSGRVTRLLPDSDILSFGTTVAPADLGSPLVGFTVPAR